MENHSQVYEIQRVEHGRFRSHIKRARGPPCDPGLTPTITLYHPHTSIPEHSLR